MIWIDRVIDAICKWVLHFFKNEKTRDKVAKLVNLEVATYLIAGVLTTLVNWIVSYIFNDLVKMSSATLISIIAWVISVAFAYWINNAWVFKDKQKDTRGELIKILKFFGSRAATGVLEVGGMGLLVDYLAWPFWPVKIVISITVIILNYVFSKLFVFTKKADENIEK